MRARRRAAPRRERERFGSTDIDTCLHNICRVVRNDVPRENNGCERSRDLMALFHMRFALVESEPSDARGGKCRSPSAARFYGFACSLTHGYGSRLEKCPNTDRELDFSRVVRRVVRAQVIVKGKIGSSDVRV